MKFCTRTCTKCGIEKPFDGFYKRKGCKFGIHPQCRDCTQEYMRNRYATREDVRKHLSDKCKHKRATDPQYVEEASRRHLKFWMSTEGRAKIMLRSAQSSPDGCTLTEDWIADRIGIGTCPVTGFEFDLSRSHQEKTGAKKNPLAPSLDRIDPHGSYSPENCRVVIWQYNMMKGELTDAEVALICKAVLENRG